MSTPDQPPDTNIVLRLPRQRKGRYVAAARQAGQPLAAWIFAALDAASSHIHFPDHDHTPPDHQPRIKGKAPRLDP